MLAPDTHIDTFLHRLKELAENLSTLYEQLAFAKRTEIELRTQAYQGSSSESISGRNRDAEIASSHATTSILELEARVDGMKEEKFYILTCLRWQGEPDEGG